MSDVPAPWREAPVHALGGELLQGRDALLDVVEAMRAARLARAPHVVLLDPAVPWSRLLAPERERRALWTLGPGHRLLRDELTHLLAGLVDARSGTPVWWPGVHACRLGATAVTSGAEAGSLALQHVGAHPDVLLPDGRPAWIDAGPRAPVLGWPDGAARVHVESVRLAGELAVERDASPTERLSDEQRAAVTHGAGPARVLAPAGSGKTRVLAARLRHLVRDRGVQPRLITALAYNTRAAQELVERTRDVVADGARPNVRTVHALSLAVCTAALGRRPAVLGTDATVAALREASAGGPQGGVRIGVAGGPPVDAVLAALTDVRLGLRDPTEVEAERGDAPGFATLLPRYRALLHARGWLDFDEQVHLAVALLFADPSLRARVQRTTTHLLVDEAQDLTPVFVLLVRLLTGPAQQLFAVGDDDQTIYGYAGATPRVLVDLPDAYRGTTTYPLTVNHRCPPVVVRAASALLRHNTVRVPKEVRPATAPPPGEAVPREALEVLDAPTGTATPTFVTRIGALLVDHDPDDVAVLARVGATLLAPQFALAAAGVPVRPHVGPEALLRTGLRTALAYLRIAVTPDRIHPEDLADTLRRPARRLTGVVGTDGRTTSLGALTRRLATVDAEHRPALRRYVDDLALLAGLARDGADASRLLAAVRDTVGLGATLDALDRRRVRPEGSSHGDDLDALVELAALEPDPAALPQRLTDHLDAAARARDDGTAHGVTLSTVHRVKGREWDVVVVVGLHAGLVPHRLCDDVEEERRVLHVAITRARRRLVLVGDPARPSPFLPELLGTLRPEAASAPDEATVVAALRAWRRDRAATDRVPAFLVAHDRTLADLARRRPQDLRALRACHGIGPARIERYGEELLALLRTGPAVGPAARPGS